MALKMRTVRGPASYLAGGAFIVTLGEVERLALSSGAVGKKVVAYTSTSTSLIPNVVSQSSNAVAIILHDTRSGGIEPAAAVDLSAIDIALIYEGV